MNAEIIIKDGAGNAACVSTPGGCVDQKYSHFEDGKAEANLAGTSAFDTTCGTWNTGSYSQSHPTCGDGKHFMCGSTSSPFAKCLDAIDCQMHHEMSTQLDSSDTRLTTFAKQMVPHHANAVAQAKALLKHMTLADAGGDRELFDTFWGIAHDIMNTQNFQIDAMGAALSGTTTLCYDVTPSGDLTTSGQSTGDSDDEKTGLYVAIGVLSGVAVIAIAAAVIAYLVMQKTAAIKAPKASDATVGKSVVV